MQEQIEQANRSLLDEQLQTARSCYTQLLSVCPPDVCAALQHNIALSWEMSQDFKQAFRLYAEVTNLPQVPLQTKVRSMTGMANCLRHLGSHARSIDMLIDVAKVAPCHPQTHFLLSSAFIRQNDIESACRAMLFGLTAVLETNAKETTNFAQCYYEPLTASVYYMKSGTATNLDLLYCECFDEKDILKFHQVKLPPLKTQPLDVVYVSEHFHKGSIMSNVLPILENHNIPFACLDLGNTRDYISEKVKKLSSLYLNTALPQQLKFKVAVCCDGHTGSKKALRLLQNHPLADVVIDCFGYPFSSGLPCVQYKLVDHITDPEDGAGMYSEEKLYLDPCFTTWAPLINDCTSHVKYSPHHNRHLIFAPNNFKKISRTCVNFYKELLRSNSRIEIHFKSASHESATSQAYFHHIFEEFSDRISVLDPPNSTRDHYDLTAKYDVVVDSFPYNGTITTLEALWCGVPVVTVKGKTHRSRVGDSILCCIGREDWVTSGQEDFCNTVNEILSQKSVEQHADVHAALCASPIMQHSEYTRKFEKILKFISFQT